MTSRHKLWREMQMLNLPPHGLATPSGLFKAHSNKRTKLRGRIDARICSTVAAEYCSSAEVDSRNAQHDFMHD